MSAPGRERVRPGRTTEADPKTFRGVDDILPLDLVNCSREALWAFLAGLRAGILQGTDMESARRERLDRLVYQRAVRIVHGNAALPEVTPEKQVPRSWTGKLL